MPRPSPPVPYPVTDRDRDQDPAIGDRVYPVPFYELESVYLGPFNHIGFELGPASDPPAA